MTRFTKRIVIVLISILLGILSYYFFAGWNNIIPWAIATLLVGYTTSIRKDAIINGSLFGYFLFLTYIIIGYNGNTDKTSITKFALFSLFFSLVGSIAAIIGTFVGYLIRERLKSSKKSNTSRLNRLSE